MLLKSSAALEVLNLLQVYFQNSLWCWWIMQFDRRQRDGKGSVLVAGLVVLFSISAIPMQFLIISAIHTSHGLSSALWLGLGCTVAALLTGGAMVSPIYLRFSRWVNRSLDLCDHLPWLPTFSFWTFPKGRGIWSFSFAIYFWFGCDNHSLAFPAC
jgi:hypothetical protein